MWSIALIMVPINLAVNGWIFSVFDFQFTEQPNIQPFNIQPRSFNSRIKKYQESNDNILWCAI